MPVDTPEPLRLDRTVPSVNAVFAVVEGAAPLQRPVDALVMAEAEAGVVVVGNPIGTWIDGVMTLRPDLPTPALPDLVRLCTDDDGLSRFVPDPNDMQTFYGETIFRLLDRTHLVLTGGGFCDDYAFVAGRTVGSAGTWRWWGDIVARWANERGIVRPAGIGETRHSRRQRPWEYIDFYMRSYVNDVIHNYDRWADTALTVLREKNRLLAGQAGIEV